MDSGRVSGVEFIVGAVLGSVPIAITAFEKYGKASEFPSTFRSRGEIENLQSRVRTQKSIFRNTAINLLLSAITNDYDLVHTVISTLGQAFRRDPTSTQSSGSSNAACGKLELTAEEIAGISRELKMSVIHRDRIDSLEETFRSCNDTIEQITAALERLVRQLEDIGMSMQRGANVSTPDHETASLYQCLWNGDT